MRRGAPCLSVAASARWVHDHTESFQTFVEQGIFADQAAVSARRYQFSDEQVAASLRRTRQAAPGAEAMVIGGSGLRSGRWRAALERLGLKGKD